MRGNVRYKMIQGATQVLSRRGLHATAFSEVLALTGTSRGSIYHHFPGGKAELIEAVLDEVATTVNARLQALRQQPAEAVASGTFAIWRETLVQTQCDAGCPVAAVTVAADSTSLLESCRHAFAQWERTLAGVLKTAGVPEAQAPALATQLIAAAEGAVLLARALGDVAPFDLVAGQMRRQAALAAEMPALGVPAPAPDAALAE